MKKVIVSAGVAALLAIAVAPAMADDSDTTGDEATAAVTAPVDSDMDASDTDDTAE